MNTRIFISADHGLALIYFLQSDITPRLLDAGVEIILLTDDEIKDQVAARFARPGLTFEGLRLRQVNDYFQNTDFRRQRFLAYLRRVGASNRINTEAMDSHIRESWVNTTWSFRLKEWLPAAFAILLLRNSAAARRALVNVQMRYTPAIYADLFAKYRPGLVIASTYGWRADRYLLREAARHGIPTMTAIVGWDNPSSYGLPASRVDWITCWSEIQKQELVQGGDWPPERVHIGGMPSYDGYFRKTWLIPKEEYFRLHHLAPDRKLIAYASSFVHFAPNYPNIEALAQLVASEELAHPSQLLIRLHPNHFQDKPAIFAEERQAIRALEQKYPHVHVVEPVPLGGSLGYYSGEDMPEKSSMMAHSDVFVTVYSTMVVERAAHGRPIVSACLDVPGGWNVPRRFSLPLSKIGNWPTHQRFRQAGAGRIAFDKASLRDAINLYLQNPDLDAENRRRFLEQELTYTDGSAGRRTADFILSLLKGAP